MEPAITYFSETQRFTQWYMWALLIALNLLLLYLLFRSFTMVKSTGNRFASVVLGFTAVVMIGITGLMFIIRLETQISERGVHVEFHPMDSETRFYSWDSISSAKVRRYDPTGEYRGWGIKGTANNRALNIAGDIGLQLVLTSKKKLLIGTQKPDELMIALARARR